MRAVSNLVPHLKDALMWIEQPETYSEPLRGGLCLRTPATPSRT